MTTTNNAAIEFINEFFKEKVASPIERKDFKRFKKAFPEDTPNLEEAYFNYCGESATYCPPRRVYSQNELDLFRSQAIDMMTRLTHDPQSFTDLYGHRDRWYNITRPASCTPGINLIRDCFYKMGCHGLIGTIEVKTCGRVAIRLYYAK